MIVVATDAPLAYNELRRLAGRAFLAIARTGSWMSHGSGDYAIAFSTRPHSDADRRLRDGGALSSLFRAVVEATEEAVLNSLFRATTVTGQGGRTAEALPVERVREILREHGRLGPDHGATGAGPEGGRRGDGARSAEDDEGESGCGS
jgi:D-aminopeptidase